MKLISIYLFMLGNHVVEQCVFLKDVFSLNLTSKIIL